jgi:branched-chain amino acid transport system ATP-binding protein
MLALRGVRACYGSVEALHGIDLDIGEGEIVALIGANGAGKTTTLMTVSGIVPVQQGQIVFRGEPIHRLPPDRIVMRGICQVPEGRRIFPQLTVAENLDMGAFLRRDLAGIRADRDRAFALFPILKERRHQAAGTLSGGEQQMLAISRALMSRPRLLLLDEPSLGLSPLMVKLIFQMISQINAEDRTTIFLVEQNAHMAMRVAGRAYVMENGAIVMEGSASSLQDNEAVKKAYLGI